MLSSHNMKCPVCSALLHRSTVEGIELDLCKHCQGIWFDRFELQKLSATEFEEIPVFDVEISNQPKLDRRCPKDQFHFMRHFFSKNIRVTIETCPKCAGIWLDPGEFSAVRKQVATNENNFRKNSTQFFENIVNIQTNPLTKK